MGYVALTFDNSDWRLFSKKMDHQIFTIWTAKGRAIKPNVGMYMPIDTYVFDDDKR